MPVATKEEEEVFIEDSEPATYGSEYTYYQIHREIFSQLLQYRTIERGRNFLSRHFSPVRYSVYLPGPERNILADVSTSQLKNIYQTAKDLTTQCKEMLLPERCDCGDIPILSKGR